MRQKISAVSRNFQDKVISATKKSWFFPGIIILFFLYNYADIYLHNAVLAGDSTYLYHSIYNPALRTQPFLQLLYNYLNSPESSSRPISGIIYGTAVYLAQYAEVIYFLLYGFFLLSVCALYQIISKLGNSYTAFLVTLFYALMPIGTTLTFMPKMSIENLAMIFYIFSLYWVVIRKKIWLSLAFFILSSLCYESFLPLFVLNILLMNEPRKTKWIYTITGISAVILYRYAIEPYIFSNYLNKENAKNLLNIGRDISILKTIPTLLWDLIVGIGKGLRAVIYYSWADWAVLLAFIIPVSIIIKNSSRSLLLARKTVLKNSGIALGLSFLIFFLSDYTPTLFQYANRTAGAVRLAFAVLLFTAIVRFTDKRAIKALLIFIITVLTISTISIKNAWIFAADTNKNVMRGIKKNLPKNPQSDIIFFTYDSSKSIDESGLDNLWAADIEDLFDDDHFVFEEPIMFMNDEMQYPQNFVRLNPKMKIYYYFTKESQGFKELPPKYYLYDYKTNSMKFVSK